MNCAGVPPPFAPIFGGRGNAIQDRRLRRSSRRTFPRRSISFCRASRRMTRALWFLRSRVGEGGVENERINMNVMLQARETDGFSD